MNVETLRDLFVYELEEAYQIETTLVDALEEVADGAAIDSLDNFSDAETRESLSDVFADHRDETAEQVERLERVFEAVDRRPETRSALALEGLLDGRDRFDNVVLNDAVRLLFYLDLGRDIERLEVRTYESLLENARALGLPDDAIEALEANLGEERDVSAKLQELSESSEVGSLRDEMADQSPQR